MLARLGCSTIPDWLLCAILFGQTAYMVLMWALSFRFKNAGMIDFAWPSSFTVIALVFFFTTPSQYVPEVNWIRKSVITLFFVAAGVRFMLGWTARTRHGGEDPRWELWRQRWRNGKGWLGFRSVAFNLFWFYQAQGQANVFFLTVPLSLSNSNPSSTLDPLEFVAIAIWLSSFILENVADMQLTNWKIRTAKQRKELQRQGKPITASNVSQVCDIGLWKYSRHPNYFFEEMLWVSYAIFAWPSARTVWDCCLLIAVPFVTYYFLVHFTGIPMTEERSLQHRGEAYRRYMARTSMIIPWFPRTKA